MSGDRAADRLLVLGIGNPILGDDGVGWRVAELVGSRLAEGDRPAAGPVDVDCVALGGLALMERLVGYDRAVLVDAVHGSGDPPGTVRVRALADLAGPDAGHLDSGHDVTLGIALQAGLALGARLPDEITVVSVEAARVDTFGEELTPPVEAAVAGAAGAVERVLGESR